MTLYWKTWFQWEVVICHKSPKSNCSSRTTKCNNRQRKVLNKATRLVTFQRFKQLTILCKQECTIMTKECEIKAKGRSKTVIRRRCTIDLQRLHFRCLGKVTLLLIPWTPFKITLMFKMGLLRITTTRSFQHMETQTLENMQLLVISSKEQFKMVLD